MNWNNEVKSYETEKQFLSEQIAILMKYSFLTSESRSVGKQCVQSSLKMIAEIKSKIANLDDAIAILKLN